MTRAQIETYAAEADRTRREQGLPAVPTLPAGIARNLRLTLVSRP